MIIAISEIGRNIIHLWWCVRLVTPLRDETHPAQFDSLYLCVVEYRKIENEFHCPLDTSRLWWLKQTSVAPESHHQKGRPLHNNWRDSLFAGSFSGKVWVQLCTIPLFSWWRPIALRTAGQEAWLCRFQSIERGCLFWRNATSSARRMSQ